MSTISEKEISGKYKHYKGQYYNVYCTAWDRNNNKYVLYQQCYGDKSFWIRPYSMFFERIEVDGNRIARFDKKTSEPQTVERIEKLKELIETQSISIRHSETEQPYVITHINESDCKVIVQRIECDSVSGYLTEYEIVKRLGYNSCYIDGQIRYFKNKKETPGCSALYIGENDIESLKQFLNPCSIDLQIANTGFLRTKFKMVDPQSVEHISSATELWKSVRKHKSKNGASEYIRIYPGTTVLTHTKERIRIPNDCAGKVEIKSTFARLSLSITYGDFCNPGYDGFFPLEIKNNGRHTIIIHENETMVQLMLIPLQGPILSGYTQKATYKNDKGYDDGTPYSFWRERSIRILRKENGTQQIIDCYFKLLNEINEKNTSDVNACKDRFSNNFLPFCHKRISKSKYKNSSDNLPDAKKLIMAYIKKENRIRSLIKIKWFSGVGTFLSITSSVLLQFLQNSKGIDNLMIIKAIWLLPIIAIILLFITISLAIFCPKTFCTFEKIDIEKLLSKLESV